MDSRTRLFNSLTTAYQAQDAALRSRIEQYIRQAWPTDSWRDADITKFAAAVQPVVDAGAVTIATLTNGYLATVARTVFGQRAVTVKPPPVTTEALRGVNGDEVWHRAGVTVWTALATGSAIEAAQKQGLERALVMTAMNLQLAKTRTAQTRFEADRNVIGYRRTLTGRENCTLCGVASENIYHRGTLMPIHPRCDCGVAPIYGDEDPAADWNNPGDLTDAPRVAVHTHGELGPLLTDAAHDFTGANAVN